MGRRDLDLEFGARVKLQHDMPHLVVDWYSSRLSKKTDAGLRKTLKKQLPALREQYACLDETYSAVPIDAARVHFAAVVRDMMPLFGELETEAAKNRRETIDRVTVVSGLTQLVMAARDLDDLAFDFGFSRKVYK